MQSPHTHPTSVSAPSTQTASQGDHNTPAVSGDEYAWPTCIACHRDLWPDEHGRHACRACQDRAAHRLASIRALYPYLDTTSALTRHRGGDSGRSGSRTDAPVPVNLAVLTLTTAGGVATRLQAIEDSWRTALRRHIGTWPGSPRQAIPVHIEFLRINLEWACESHLEVADDLEEIRRLHDQCTTALRGALDPGERRPGPVPIGPCPTPLPGLSGAGPAAAPGAPALCGTPLTTRPGAQRVHCPTCGTTWEGATAWINLRRAQNTHTPTTAAA
ncbi:hypothetical protein [Actinacidiphila acididurans]|uniref:GATA-type domain-containing protein n=1 Tax=Actinacidiphila acididurans TaxID=2784346 RepID=A0ABS2U305_9ACTN|nr:hypothetical protein [Actinacidiphila acididurans]MBM9509964.1 hypothetical protein [Actinacidiphila acididurans]